MEVLTAEEEAKILKEVPTIDIEKLDHYMELFAKWVAAQPHLPQSYSGNCLKKFLIWAKLDFEKAKRRFEKFCYSTVTHKEYFRNRSITLKADLKPLKYLSMVHMPKVTPCGLKVTIFKILDAELLDIDEVNRYFALAFQYRIRVDNTVAGEIVIFDGERLKSQHFGKIFNTSSFKFMKFTVSRSPFLVKHIFIVNCHPILEKGFNLHKNILPVKVANRLTVLKDYRELQNHIPPQCLPSDFGGTAETMEQVQRSLEQHFVENDKFYVDLGNLQPTGPIPEEYKDNYDNEFGVEGSFRKLNID